MQVDDLTSTRRTPSGSVSRMSTMQRHPSQANVASQTTGVAASSNSRVVAAMAEKPRGSKGTST